MGINVIHRDSPCVIDHKQAVAGSRQQREPDIRAHLIDAAVVLREGLQVTLRREAPVKAEADQIGGKVTFPQIDNVARVAAGPGQVRTLANAAA